MVSSAINSVLQGLAWNQQRFAEHADRISRWGLPGPSGIQDGIELEKEMVGMMVAKRGYQANLAVVRAADEMLGSIIDILA